MVGGFAVMKHAQSESNYKENMNVNTKFILLAGLLAICLGSPLVSAEEEEHEGEGDNAVELNAEEQHAAGITIERVLNRELQEAVRIPAEVIINAYQSSRVTPRIRAQVVARHARLGDHVEEGRKLVTLTSVEMAEAQGTLIVAARDWQRVKSLGSQAVSERRYIEAEVTWQQAMARVQAYGLTEAQALELMDSGDASNATGKFDLLAPQAGTILRDEFIIGELIDPGRVLFDISDESVMWVEARAVPGSLPNVEIGSPARVSVDGEHWLNGTVIQRHHRLDETTRTQALRIEVPIVDDDLHPGQFVEAEIITGATEPVMAVPLASVTIIEGDPTVFRLVDGHEFEPVKILTGDTIGDWIAIEAGLEEGDEIAVAGVFHIKSLLLKSSMGEGHAH